ncbi:Uncharacterised protein [Mycobacteroides abscessus subsp. massiliense]|nr:Uncharacterised protein [Mycobacteroides abscessus subsp. massiliense]
MSHNAALRIAATGLYAGIGIFALAQPARVPQIFGGAIVNTCGSGVSGDLRFGVLIAV